MSLHHLLIRKATLTHMKVQYEVVYMRQDSAYLCFILRDISVNNVENIQASSQVIWLAYIQENKLTG